MDSAGIKAEPLIQFTNIEVMPIIGGTEGSNSRSVVQKMLELEEDQAPQFYATILMKDEQSEDFCHGGCGDVENKTCLLAEGMEDCQDDARVGLGAPKRVFRCSLCDKEYVRKDHLNYHMKIHAGFKNFKCDICYKEFRQRVHLKNHKKVHTGERDFRCEICGKDFVLKHHLTTHNTKIHMCVGQTVGGAKRCFKCHICTKEFLRKDHFLYHTKIHTGLRDFKCTVCSKEFRQKTHLKNHLKLHTGERDFKCDMCGKEFSLKHHLTTHNLRIHTNSANRTDMDSGDLRACTICNKEFITQGHFNRHMKVHSSLNEFV